MPVVNIVVTWEGTSPEQSRVTPHEKARLIAGASQLLLEVLGRPLGSTFVIIQEIEPENLRSGGLPVVEHREAHSRLGNLGPKTGGLSESAVDG